MRPSSGPEKLDRTGMILTGRPGVNPAKPHIDLQIDIQKPLVERRKPGALTAGSRKPDLCDVRF
jgi:hypothetical protein